MKYRIYIDEVGNPDLESSDNPNHRFLSLTGIIFELEYVKKIVFPKLETLKNKYFNAHPDEPIVLHRKELFKADYPFETLRDPKTRKSFDEEILNLLEKLNYTIITVCLDKKPIKKHIRRGDMIHIIIV